MKTIVSKALDKKLLDQWISLWDKSPKANYTNSPYWFLSVIETFTDRDFVIVATYDNEQLVAIGGLMQEKKYGANIYTVYPTDFVCGLPFLIDSTNRTALRNFFKALIDLRTVYLENVTENFIVDLKTVLEVKTTNATINYYVAVEKDETGEVIVRKKKRLLRRSEMIEHELELREFLGSDPDALEIAFAIDQKSNKQAHGYNAFADKQIIIFYQMLQKNFHDHFSLYILYHKAKPIAYQVGFRVGTIFFCSQIAFLKEYEIYSIGRSLLIRLIEHLGKTGIQTIDFGSGEDHVKKSLTKDYRMLHSLIITNNTLMKRYIIGMSKTKSYLYSTLHKNRFMYAMYRKIKNVLKKK